MAEWQEAHLGVAPCSDSLNYSQAGLPTHNIFAGLDTNNNQGGFEPSFYFGAWNSERTNSLPANFPFTIREARHGQVQEARNPQLRPPELGSTESTQLHSITKLPMASDDPNARLVNCKQWLRMMKRRVKRQLEKTKAGDMDPQQILSGAQTRGYRYQSRHAHAVSRTRGQDGRFVATRSLEDRSRKRGRRGRKPKCPTAASECPETLLAAMTSFPESS